MPTKTPLPEIERRLIQEIQTLLALPDGKVTSATSLQSLGMDSLRFVSLLIAIEKNFAINLMKAGLKRETLQSVATLAAAIHAGLPA